MLSYRKSQQASLTEKLKKKNVIHAFGVSGSGTTMARLCHSAFVRVATRVSINSSATVSLCHSAFVRVATLAHCRSWRRRVSLPQRIRAGCDAIVHTDKLCNDNFATAHSCGLRHLVFNGSSWVLIFATAHSCGLRLRKSNAAHCEFAARR